MKIISRHQEGPLEWAEKHFGDIEIGDIRRERRVVTIAGAMAAKPEGSLPQIMSRVYDLKATYKFLQREDIGPDDLQAWHRERVKEEMGEEGTYLLIEDTSELTWSGKKPVVGLGPVGNGAAGLQGVHLHSVLAVKWRGSEGDEDEIERKAVEIIGLVDQQYHVRKRRPDGENKINSQAAKRRERESQLWEKASERIGEAPEEKEVKWIRVCDRGADIYEMMTSCEENNHRYVVRASQNRALTNSGGRAAKGQLFAVVRTKAAIGGFRLKMRKRPTQPARIANLTISVTKVWLRSPWRPGKPVGYMKPIECSAVRVWEENPPRGAHGLEWILLTDLAAENFAEALEIALIYSTRWLIEEFHKALKTGTRAEELQLETGRSLFAAIGIKSVVALRLIELRERFRMESSAPAKQSGLSKLELDVLRMISHRTIKTVRDVALALGRLGGHLNRKSDGLPGWQTLWRGMSKLTDLVAGVQLASKIKSFG